MTEHKTSELLGLLREKQTALRKNDFRAADRLSHKINAFAQENADTRFSREQTQRISRSFKQVELILASQKQAVSQQLQTLRNRKGRLKTYQDQVKA